MLLCRQSRPPKKAAAAAASAAAEAQAAADAAAEAVGVAFGADDMGGNLSVNELESRPSSPSAKDEVCRASNLVYHSTLAHGSHSSSAACLSLDPMHVECRLQGIRSASGCRLFFFYGDELGYLCRALVIWLRIWWPSTTWGPHPRMMTPLCLGSESTSIPRRIRAAKAREARTVKRAMQALLWIETMPLTALIG